MLWKILYYHIYRLIHWELWWASFKWILISLQSFTVPGENLEILILNLQNNPTLGKLCNSLDEAGTSRNLATNLYFERAHTLQPYSIKMFEEICWTTLLVFAVGCMHAKIENPLWPELDLESQPGATQTRNISCSPMSKHRSALWSTSGLDKHTLYTHTSSQRVRRCKYTCMPEKHTREFYAVQGARAASQITSKSGDWKK